MNGLRWMNEEIYNLNNMDLDVLKTLLPYWGITLRNNTLTGALISKKLYVASDKVPFFYSLLAHTGIEIIDLPASPDLVIEINISDKYAYPLSITDAGKTYHPKAMAIKSLNLQKRIHKNVWLPDITSPLQCSIHPEHIETSMEWLSYITIQYFMKQYFKPIDHLSLTHYEYLVKSVLDKVNPHFSSFQVSAISVSEWPSLPGDDLSSRKNNTKQLSASDERQIISPFKPQQSKKDREIFDPFKFNREKKHTSVINPFYRK